MTTLTVSAPPTWTPALEVQVQWDSRLEKTLASIRQGIEEASRGDGRYLTDDDLAPDNDE